MDTLDHAGWVQPDPSKPKDTAWLVNPRVHECFSERAKVEKARREAVRLVMLAPPPPATRRRCQWQRRTSSETRL